MISGNRNAPGSDNSNGVNGGRKMRRAAVQLCGTPRTSSGRHVFARTQKQERICPGRVNPGRTENNRINKKS